MIKFFRRIRQQLLSEGNTTKYLKYAIGEIILVVIGILIALQINNWNENRKATIKQIEILSMLEESLIDDLDKFEEVANYYARSKMSINTILNHLQKDLPLNDSLPSHFFKSTTIWEQSSFTNGIYETLKSNGIDLISNKKLSQQIVKVFDETDPWMETWEKRYVDLVLNSATELYKTRFTDFWNGNPKDPKVNGEMHPISYESLKSDEEYIYFLKTQKNLMGWLIEKSLNNSATQGETLLEMLRKEMSSLKKSI